MSILLTITNSDPKLLPINERFPITKPVESQDDIEIRVVLCEVEG